MEMPDIAIEVRDTEREVTYRVLAYRKLEPAEAMQYARIFLRQQKKKPKRRSVVTIVTTVS